MGLTTAIPQELARLGGVPGLARRAITNMNINTRNTPRVI